MLLKCHFLPFKARSGYIYQYIYISFFIILGSVSIILCTLYVYNELFWWNVSNIIKLEHMLFLVYMLVENVTEMSKFCCSYCNSTCIIFLLLLSIFQCGTFTQVIYLMAKNATYVTKISLAQISYVTKVSFSCNEGTTVPCAPHYWEVVTKNLHLTSLWKRKQLKSQY